VKIIKITKNNNQNYTFHGIAHTEHNGYHGTSDNRMSIKKAILYEYNNYIKNGENFLIMLNGKLLKNGAIFKKDGLNDLELLNY
jgi:hypothetical protein